MHSTGKGKGKAKPADPFRGMAAEGPPDKGEGKRHARVGPREPDPCSRCGEFFVCKGAAGKCATEGYCTNPRCERSKKFKELSPEAQAAQLASNVAAARAKAAQANLVAAGAAQAAAAASAAGALLYTPPQPPLPAWLNRSS